MSRNLLTAAAWLMLLILLAAGIYVLFGAPAEPTFSETENRMLAERPAFSLTAFFDRSFADGLETYLADRFPARIRIIDSTRELKQLGSLATWEEYARVAQSDVAVMDIPKEETESGTVTVTPRPTRTPAPTATPTAVPRETPVPEEESGGSKIIIFIVVVLVGPVSGGDKGQKARFHGKNGCGRGCGHPVEKRGSRSRCPRFP